MERVALTDDLSFSRIVYGMWRLADGTDRSVNDVRAKVEACLAAGITTFDQADIYGDYESEATFGQLLKAEPALRGRMEIASKCGIKLLTDKVPGRRVKHYDTSAEHIRASVDRSLSNMGIEQLDLLMIHRPDPFMDHEETGRALDALVASGKVRTIGVSNFVRDDIELLEVTMENPIVTNQIEISVLANAPFRNGEIAYMQARGMKPMAWSPLAGGALFSNENSALVEKLAAVGETFGVDTTAVALAFLLAHPSKILPVVGTNNVSRIETLADAFKVAVDRETWFDLYTAAVGHEVP